MKAVRINEWGQPVQIEEIPQPTPNNDEVLVRVRAASINPVDRSVIAGYLQSMLSVPMTAGTDFAGEVVAAGAQVTHVKPGDAVYGFVPIRGGTFAEYAVVKANEVALKPETLDYVQAAAVPLVALTAWQALFDLAQLQSDERVLIHGTTGGVGSFAVQFAKEKDVYVIGTGSPEKVAFGQALGVDQYINYQEQRFEEVVRDVDVVLDTVGGDSVERAYAVLKPGGRLVTTAAQPSQEEAPHDIRVYGAFTQPTVNHLAMMAELIDTGKVKVFVSRIFPMEEAQAALALAQQRETPGKVVCTID
jgi:NADPH:quinone reductase-like Zn-dependent oxidoreductase